MDFELCSSGIFPSLDIDPAQMQQQQQRVQLPKLDHVDHYQLLRRNICKDTNVLLHQISQMRVNDLRGGIKNRRMKELTEELG